MTRKRAHDEDVTEYIDLDDSEMIEPPTSKKSRNENGVEDKIDIWLIKKPRNISLQSLNQIRLPKKLKDSNRDRSFETEKDGTLDCTFERPSRTMLYFQAPQTLHNIKEGAKLPIVSQVRGVATLKIQAEVDDPFPEAFEEDPELAEWNIEPEVCPLPFEIKSIRKKPKLAEGPVDRPNVKKDGEGEVVPKKRRSKAKKPKTEGNEDEEILID